MKFRAILIDLDGTLLDTIPDLSAAANMMLAELGAPTLPVPDVATFVGKGTENLVKRCLNDDRVRAALAEGTGHATPSSSQQVAHALEIFNRHYHAVNGREARLYPGVLEGLKAFRDQGVFMAVVTNKPTEFTLPLLASTKLDQWFDVIICGDTCERKKPDPQPLLHACAQLDTPAELSLAIGDSINDALAARAAGMTVLAVPYGYNEGMDVRELDIDGIVSGIDEAYTWAMQSHQADHARP